MKLSFVAAVALVCAACSASSSSTSDAGGAPPAADASSAAGHAARIVLQIPAGYTGTLAKLDLVYNATPQLLGPPTGTLYEGTPTGVAAGMPLTVTGDATGVRGDYYVVAVLYMQGGGTFVPKPGVDYVAESPAPIAFDGTAIDLGTLPVVVAPADGGL